MPRYGTIVVIKRNGTDGIVFPLTSTSCLFGRKTECDIRMRLPWVSNEHCKIEINENKEAVLINLSSVNPTQLNGACFEQPVALKHGDVLTIIDRSFRFEYPLQPTPKKRRSRSPKDESLQVLHVQQVAEVELLHKQSAGAESVDASDNSECEEKNANEKRQTPDKNLPGAFPVKLQTPKSSQRKHRALKKQTDISPFSKLYENLKKKLEAEKPLHRAAAGGEPGRVLPEPGAPISSLLDLSSLAKGRETGRVEKCVGLRCDDGISPHFHQLRTAGTPRSFPRSPGTPISKEVAGDGSQSRDAEGSRTPGRSRGTAVTPRGSQESPRNSLSVLEPCSITRMECPYRGTVSSPTRATPSGSEIQLSTPRRMSPRSLFVSPPRESPGMNPRESVAPLCSIIRADTLFQEGKWLNQRQNSKEETPGKPVQEVLKEIWHQAKLHSLEVGPCETPSSVSDSKSPRRRSRERKKSLDKSAQSVALASEEVLASPGHTPARKRRKARSSGAALEADPAQDHQDSGRKARGTPECHHKQHLGDAATPQRASAKRGSGGAAGLRDPEPASEIRDFGLLHGEDSGKKKQISQKRRRDETLPQAVGKRKRVSFGDHLSPELFDKSLPPNSPLKKGALPARQSLPCGDSPRAVLKKAQDLKHLINQEEETSPKTSPSQESSGSSSSFSGKATPKIPAGSPAPARRGRFSISQPPTAPPIAEEEAATEHPEGKTPKSPAPQDARVTVTPSKVTVTSSKPARGGQALKGSARRSRGGAVAAISAKRRSGASNANLLVAKSWAEVVKMGVPRSQSRTAKKRVCKGRAQKKINHPPKTPEKKIKDHFSTGHAESPATIVIGRAFSTRVRSAGHVPKVVKNQQLMLNMDMDESFTGVPEMLQTPENQGGRTIPLAAAQNADFTPPWAAGEISDLHTPEESGEMMVSPLNNSDASEQKQESPGIFCFLGEESSPSMFDETATKTPEKRQDHVDSLAITPAKPTSLGKSGSKRRTPKQKLEPAEVMSSKRKILSTPEPRSEPEEVLSGVKRLMKTPRQKSEPTEDLSGIKQLMKTPNQKLEPVEVLSGIRELLKTPKQKLEPVEVLSGIKQLMKTPKQKLEPVEVLSGIRQLLKTPKQKLEPGEVLSGIRELLKTPEQKPEPGEVLSGIKQLMKTPKQKLEPGEVVSGVKQLMKTPKQRLEPGEVLSGIRELLKTPKQKLEPVEVLSGIRELLKTPEQKPEPGEDLSGIKQLLKTPKQRLEPVEVLSGIRELLKTPKQKLEPGEVLSGIKQLMKTPKQKLEPVEVLSGIKQLMKTPKQKLEPVEVLSGIRELLKTPEQKPEPGEDLSGIKQLMKTPKQKLEPVEVLSGIRELLKTPEQKPEPGEVLSGIKQLMKTPKQKLEPVEVLSGIKQLMKTPKQKPKPVEDLSGIKQLLRTPQQELEPVTDEIALKKLLETPVESRKAGEAVPGVNSPRKSPKLKSQPVEDMVGISRIFQTPKEKVEPIENMFGMSRLMKSLKKKHPPVEDFVGLQKLMAEPRQKSADAEVDYAGMTEMFGSPEEMKVRSVNVMDSPEEIAPPGSNSSHKREKRGKVSQGEDSEQKDSSGEEQPAQRPRRGRGARVVPAAAKPSENGVSSKELQSPGAQEEMGVTTPEKGRGRRTKRSVQEAVPKQPDLEGLDIVSSGAAQRAARGKRKELKEVKQPNENLESCVEDSSVLHKAPANTKESLQGCGVSETEDDPGTKTGPGNIQDEICQLQTDLNNADSKAGASGTEENGEVLLSSRRRCRGAENTEPVIPPKRVRRARNNQGKATSPGDLSGTTRKLRKEPSPKAAQRQEQACNKAPEAVTAQEAENGTKLQLKAAERRVRSLRSTRNRKHSAEMKADTAEVALENTQNVQKIEETSTKSDAETQSHVNNEVKGSQGCETENAQESPTEAARGINTESPSAETNKTPVPAQNMETNRARNRRGKKGSLEQKADEFTENVNSLKPVNPEFESGTEVDECSVQDSLGSVGAREEQPSPGVTSVPAADRATSAQGTQRRARNERGILKTKQTEILQENPAPRNTGVCTKGRGKKVNFHVEEGSSEATEGESLPEDGEGMADNQHENSENPPSQGRRSRRKQLDSSPALMENQTLSAGDGKGEAVQEQGSALEAEDAAPRRGRRREVAAVSQSRSPSVRTRRGLLAGAAKNMAQREDENPALGNQTSQEKVNAPARSRRKKMDPAAETSSTPPQSKGDLSEDKDEGSQEEQSVPVEAVACAEEEPAGRSRRKGAALASHTASSISLRGKRRRPAGDGEEAPKEEQNVPSETCDPCGKENQLRRSRRKEIAPLTEGKSSSQGNQVSSKQSGRKNNSRETEQSLDNSSQENLDLVKGSSRQATTSLALSPTSPQGLPEDGKDGAPEEPSEVLDVAPPAKENPSRESRKKTTSSTSGETISTSLRGKPNLPRDRGQKNVLKGSEDASPEDNPRQVKSKRRKVEFPLDQATSPQKSSDLLENGSTLENQDLSGASTGSEENQPGKGQEGDPAPQAAPASRRRRGQQPAEHVAPKKFQSGNDENGSLQRGRRNRTKLGEETARAAQSTAGMERRTRSSTITRK